MDENDENDGLLIPEPPALLPDLTEYGIEQVERGVCLDNAQNRRILRGLGFRYEDVWGMNGEPTPYIRALSSEVRANGLLASKAPILVDPKRPNSDYITGLDLLLLPNVEELVPFWVLAETRRFVKVQDEREERRNPHYHPSLISPPGRCRAKRTDGDRCQQWHGGRDTQDSLCRVHLNRQSGKSTEFAPANREKARNRLIEAATAATEILQELAETATSEPVRLGAVNSILDRAGVRGGTEIDVKAEVAVVDSAAIVKGRLAEIARRAQEQALEAAQSTQPELEPLEAEVVEDENV